MNDREAASVVGLLNAYYPRERIPDSTVAVWMKHLRPYGFVDTQEVIAGLAEASKRLPSLAEVVDGVRRRRSTQSVGPELPAPEPSRVADRVKERLAPSDDELPFLEAREYERKREEAARAFRAHRFKTQPAVAAEWERVSAELGEGATDHDIGAEINRLERERYRGRHA